MEAKTYSGVGVLPALRVSDKSNQCLLSSTTSKSAWKRSLQRGCLNKSVGDKLQIYSHIRALSCRKLSKPFTKDQGISAVPSFASTSTYRSSITNDHDSNLDFSKNDVNLTYQTQVSPVVREDLSKPPDMSLESSPQLFRVDEFIQYVWSESWNEEICLRVVGGILLEYLLTSLYDLEKRQQFNGHVVYANLNNRRKALVRNEYDKTKSYRRRSRAKSVSIKEHKFVTGQRRKILTTQQTPLSNASLSVSETSSRGHGTDLRKCHDTISNIVIEKSLDATGLWSYETMVVQLVFYEKANASNITYRLPVKTCTVSESYQPSPVSRDVVRPPYSRIKHKTNDLRSRLPDSEKVDIVDRIAILTSELEKHAAYQAANEEYNRVTAEVNKQQPTDRKKSVPLSEMKRDQKDRVPDVLYTSRSIDFITDDIRFVGEKKHEVFLPVITQQKSYDMPTHEKLDSFLDISKRYWNCIDDIIDDKQIPKYERLNLTGEELYINGLYLPRDKNNRPIAEKLKLARKKRQTLNDKNKQYEKLGWDMKSDISTKQQFVFKTHPQKNKDNIAKNVKLIETEQSKNINICERLWKRYIKEQETMEMGLAINNKMGRDIHKRATTIKKASASDDADSITSKLDKKQKTKKPIKEVRTEVRNSMNINTSKMRESSDDPDNNKNRLLPHLTSDSKFEEQAREPEHECTESDTDSNINSANLPPRQSQTSTNYFYVPDFQEPVPMSPSPPSDYQRERNFRIMEHTPYAITAQESTDVKFKYFNKWQEFARFKSANSPVNSLNREVQDGEFSRQHFITHFDDKESQNKPVVKDLADYSCECTCVECTNRIDELAYLRPNFVMDTDGCPLRLGHLRRDFSFLKGKNNKLPVRVIPQKVISHFVNTSTPQISEELLKMVDHIMIRKEMLTSSLGHTYITVTFTKRKLSKV